MNSKYPESYYFAFAALFLGYAGLLLPLITPIATLLSCPIMGLSLIGYFWSIWRLFLISDRDNKLPLLRILEKPRQKQERSLLKFFSWHFGVAEFLFQTRAVYALLFIFIMLLPNYIDYLRFSNF